MKTNQTVSTPPFMECLHTNSKPFIFFVIVQKINVPKNWCSCIIKILVLNSSSFYSNLSASIGFNFAAFLAGRIQKIIQIAVVSDSAVIITSKVISAWTSVNILLMI